MIDKINFFFISLILLLPLSLITGPAIPDITITFTGIYFLFYIFLTKSYKKYLEIKLVKISIIFWLFLLFISIFADNSNLAYRDSLIFIRYLLIPLFVVYLIFNQIKYLKILVGIIFYSVLFVCIDSIYQFFNYNPEFGFGKDLLGFSSHWYGRLTGPFNKELVPGAYCSKFGLIGLVYIFTKFKDQNKQNIITIIYISLIGIVTYISGERMAFATFLLGTTILLLLYKNKRIVFLTSLILLITSCILINYSHPVYNDYKIISSSPNHLGLVVEKNIKCNKNDTEYNCKKIIKLQPGLIEILKNFKNSAYGEIYGISLKMFFDHKLQGIGLNNYKNLCKKNSSYTKNIKNCASHPHNIYLQWLVETGVFGLFIFIIYLYYIFDYILRNNFNKFSIIALSNLVILFWPIMSTGSLLKNWNSIGIFFIVGICLILGRLKKNDE